MKPLKAAAILRFSSVPNMFCYVRDCRVILFVLGLLPNAIVNLSTNHRSELEDNHPEVSSTSRILPGPDGYQIDSPTMMGHLQQEESGTTDYRKERRRYQLIGTSQFLPKFNGSENFVTNANQSDKALGVDRRWIKKMLKKRKYSDQNMLLKKQVMGQEAKDQLVVDDGHHGNVVRRPIQDSNDDLRSGYNFDSYGDWHHSGADHGYGGNGFTGAGSGYFGNGGYGHNQHSGITNGHAYGSGHHLAGLHLLNPLILVATISFVISLINVVLGVVDRFKPSVVRARIDAPQYARIVDEELFQELGKLYGSVHGVKN